MLFDLFEQGCQRLPDGDRLFPHDRQRQIDTRNVDRIPLIEFEGAAEGDQRRLSAFEFQQRLAVLRMEIGAGRRPLQRATILFKRFVGLPLSELGAGYHRELLCSFFIASFSMQQFCQTRTWQDCIRR